MGVIGTLILTTSLAGVVGTGLGGLVGALLQRDSNRTVSLLLSFAGGVMLSVVCFDLVVEAIETNTGIVFVVASIAFGVAITYVIAAGVNVILEALTGIATLAVLPVSSAFIMICVSFTLTLISGLIPAQAAAKKDPVIALRTE